MKKIFLTLICSLISVVAFCQTTEHLKFMGIPINGTPNAFAQKMTAKGFKHLTKEDTDHSNAYAGKFAGDYNCKIVVFTYKNTVYAVLVNIPFEGRSWEYLKSEYLNMIEHIYANYDAIAVTNLEYFDSPFQEGNSREFCALSVDMCRFTKGFSIYGIDDEYPSGIITSISISRFYEPALTVYYTDGINFAGYSNYKELQRKNGI